MQKKTETKNQFKPTIVCQNNTKKAIKNINREQDT